jgi:Dynamin GTPase effector domain
LKVRLVLSSLSCDGDVFSLHTRIVALLRFVDYVSLVIDTVLVRGLCDGLANVIRQSFRFSEDNAAERCSYLLQEPPEIKGMRDHLRQKQVRLTRAAEELRRHGLCGA